MVDHKLTLLLLGRFLGAALLLGLTAYPAEARGEGDAEKTRSAAEATPTGTADAEAPTAEASGMKGAHLRIARPTDDLEPLVRFYRDGLGFEVLSGFEDHEGFDGVMLGHVGAGYHLELTRQRGHQVGRAPNPEHLLIFYLPDKTAWQDAVERLESLGYKPVPPNNPYWLRHGKTFEDPDGYRVVLQNAAWD